MNAGATRRLRLALIAVIVIAMLGLVQAWKLLSPTDPGFAWLSLTPEAAVRQQVACPIIPGSFQSTPRPISGRVIVLYHAQCSVESGRPPEDIVGEHMVELTMTGWQSVGGGSSGGLRPAVSNRVRTVSVSRGDNPGQQHTLVSGLVGGPDVATVEIIFGNGETYRDTVANDLFGVAVPATLGVCELRTRDTQGNIVERIDLNTPMNNTTSSQQVITNQCPS